MKFFFIIFLTAFIFPYIFCQELDYIQGKSNNYYNLMNSELYEPITDTLLHSYYQSINDFYVDIYTGLVFPNNKSGLSLSVNNLEYSIFNISFGFSLEALNGISEYDANIYNLNFFDTNLSSSIKFFNKIEIAYTGNMFYEEISKSEYIDKGNYSKSIDIYKSPYLYTYDFEINFLDLSFLNRIPYLKLKNSTSFDIEDLLNNVYMFNLFKVSNQQLDSYSNTIFNPVKGIEFIKYVYVKSIDTHYYKPVFHFYFGDLSFYLTPQFISKNPIINSIELSLDLTDIPTPYKLNETNSFIGPLKFKYPSNLLGKHDFSIFKHFIEDTHIDTQIRELKEKNLEFFFLRKINIGYIFNDPTELQFTPDSSKGKVYGNIDMQLIFPNTNGSIISNIKAGISSPWFYLLKKDVFNEGIFYFGWEVRWLF